MRPNSAADVMSCTECRESNEECGTFCYKVVKHLFQYLRISAEKNDQYEKLQEKLQQQEATKNSLESKANAHKEALSNCSEDKLKAEKETLKLQTKITELQKKLAEQKEALKKSDKLKDSLMSEKDKRIAQIEEQMNSMEHENKILKDELTKQKDRAEATSCLAFGNSNGIQTIRVPGAEAFKVPCDSKFAGEGWTVIQRRVDGSVNFNRTWEEYRNGFGDLRGEFWLGLEKLHLMTKFQPHELYIQLEDFKNGHRYAHYTNIAIRNESELYKLSCVGCAGLSDHNDMAFSTPDRDNDKSYRNCATYYACGWWFNDCVDFNPNGIYVKTKTDEVHDRSIKWVIYHKKPLKFVQMMIRPTKNCVPFGDDIQTIRVPGTDAFQVACDSRLAGEGWTVIQRRADRAVNFNQQWDGYKNGFGHLRGSFWLGLERLHLMTKLQPHELYIHMEDFRNRTRYARYSNFCIGNEAQSYELLALGEYTGNAGNALDTGNEYSAMNLKFSTPDRDHDKSRTSCALLYKSGWWFYKCYT
ncbi:maker549, partial [Drosophila busckii]